jgi:hypothetical protein
MPGRCMLINTTVSIIYLIRMYELADEASNLYWLIHVIRSMVQIM